MASLDLHSSDGIYTVRSLYFDDLNDTALKEKVAGVNKREKFRIRYYNGDTSFIRLEKKSKLNGLGNKSSTRLTTEEVTSIVECRIDDMIRLENEVVRELCYRMKYRNLYPRTIVEYTREPFIYAPGNVRVTIDKDIRMGINPVDFLNPDSLTIPAGNAPKIILEVKWDEYLPDIIKDCIRIPDRYVTAFSKYAQCRVYG